jgi:hypothetical protein
LIFITERGKFGDEMSDVLVGLSRRSFLARITSLLNNWMFNEEIPNINRRSGMRKIDNYFILLIVVGDMGEKASETIQRI